MCFWWTCMTLYRYSYSFLLFHCCCCCCLCCCYFYCNLCCFFCALHWMCFWKFPKQSPLPPVSDPIGRHKLLFCWLAKTFWLHRSLGERSSFLSLWLPGNNNDPQCVSIPWIAWLPFWQISRKRSICHHKWVTVGKKTRKRTFAEWVMRVCRN